LICLMVTTGILVILAVVGVVLLYSAWEKFSAKSRADGIFADWKKQGTVDPRLKQRTIALMNNDMQRIERLLENARLRNPDKSEQWYWEKILYDLERDHRG
jgi:hypothetical protein